MSGSETVTPVRAVVRGVIAGAVGTAAFDAFLYARYRRAGGKEGSEQWEFSADLASWADGAQYGVIVGSLPKQRVLYGLPFGASVWASGYVILPAAKLYKPIWKYHVKTLAKDLSGHLVYGVSTATAMKLLTASR